MERHYHIATRRCTTAQCGMQRHLFNPVPTFWHTHATLQARLNVWPTSHHVFIGFWHDPMIGRSGSWMETGLYSGWDFPCSNITADTTNGKQYIFRQQTKTLLPTLLTCPRPPNVVRRVLSKFTFHHRMHCVLSSTAKKGWTKAQSVHVTSRGSRNRIIHVCTLFQTGTLLLR